MSWFAEAPSNIALIKYMGKQNSNYNIPDNPSFSYTLPHLLTRVTLQAIDSTNDKWTPLITKNFAPPTLSERARERFLAHLQRLKHYFGYEGAFLVSSANNFPASTGLASSASSFAALTQCAIQALSELTHRAPPDLQTQASLSRQGSGSSCRSFLAPFVKWSDETIETISLPYKELLHRVLLIETAEKKISSSEAHRRVKTSPLYPKRVLYIKQRLENLLIAFQYKDWEKAKNICCDEFQEMHALFHTANEPFFYQTKTTRQLLTFLETYWREVKDGPIITMDAGPNIHLLFRKDQISCLKTLENTIQSDYPHVSIL